ncbi:hypothetical protein DID76_01950 [Candidatus Marinamargulisbacteria bacterium SCGC AG-414-C22]|nr:hypothetical protein DID76_01950 [Candidatus Marinamargulisbacteria bacterium SCGC AG-414-C22]
MKNNNKQPIKFSRKSIFGHRCPLIDVTLLTNENVMIPNQLNQKTTILYLAGPQSQQAHLDSWSASLRKTFSSNQLNHFELLYISENAELKPVIDQLRTVIKPEFYHMVGICKTFLNVQKPLLLNSKKDVYVFVLDVEGDIIFSQQGPATEFDIFRITRSIRNSLQTNSEQYKVTVKKPSFRKNIAVFGENNPLTHGTIESFIQSNTSQTVTAILESPSKITHLKYQEYCLATSEIARITIPYNITDYIIFLDHKNTNRNTYILQWLENQKQLNSNIRITMIRIGSKDARIDNEQIGNYYDLTYYYILGVTIFVNIKTILILLALCFGYPFTTIFLKKYQLVTPKQIINKVLKVTTS